MASPVKITVKNGDLEVVDVTPEYDPVQQGYRYPAEDYPPGAHLVSRGPYTVVVRPPHYSRRSVLYHEGGTSVRRFELQIGRGGEPLPGAEVFELGRVRIRRASKAPKSDAGDRQAPQDAPVETTPAARKHSGRATPTRKTAKRRGSRALAPKSKRRGSSRKRR